MAAFDTALPPANSTPATTSNATLFTSSADASILLDIANLSTSAQTVRAGITSPASTGTVHWKLHDVSVPSDDSLLSVGPWFIQSGDAVTVAAGSTGSVVTFSLTGVETSV